MSRVFRCARDDEADAVRGEVGRGLARQRAVAAVQVIAGRGELGDATVEIDGVPGEERDDVRARRSLRIADRDDLNDLGECRRCRPRPL